MIYFRDFLHQGSIRCLLKPRDDDYESFDQILTAIESPDPGRRNHAALHAQVPTEALVDALFRAIARPEYRHNRGTLVFVLQAFNCEDRFTELFDLAVSIPIALTKWGTLFKDLRQILGGKPRLENRAYSYSGRGG